jgi:hypothetical protein
MLFELFRRESEDIIGDILQLVQSVVCVRGADDDFLGILSVPAFRESAHDVAMAVDDHMDFHTLPPPCMLNQVALGPLFVTVIQYAHLPEPPSRTLLWSRETSSASEFSG